ASFVAWLTLYVMGANAASAGTVLSYLMLGTLLVWVPCLAYASVRMSRRSPVELSLDEKDGKLIVVDAKSRKERFLKPVKSTKIGANTLAVYTGKLSLVRIVFENSLELGTVFEFIARHGTKHTQIDH
ncbi:MAG TPA: hypothetical protein VMS77_09565, partial [Conexivisphaerales archaeon]|nr:hypothetical protein [Conexivisphaerales archaeon]